MISQAVNNWIRVTRANFLPVSIFPYSIGAAFAVRDCPFSILKFLLGVMGGGLVLIAASLLNEYWDHRFGADRIEDGRHPHFGGSKAIQEGIVSPAAVLRAVLICFSLIFITGGVLSIFLGSWMLAVLILAASFIAWAYTAPPLRLIYQGWGEAVIFIAFGPLLVSGGYLLQAGRVTLPLLLLSSSTGFMTTAVLIANEFGDSKADARAGKNNLRSWLGPRRTLLVFRGCLSLSYLIPVAGALAGIFPIYFLWLSVSLPLALRVDILLSRGIGRGGDFELSSARMIFLYNIFMVILIGCIIFL